MFWNGLKARQSHGSECIFRILILSHFIDDLPGVFCFLCFKGRFKVIFWYSYWCFPRKRNVLWETCHFKRTRHISHCVSTSWHYDFLEPVSSVFIWNKMSLWNLTRHIVLEAYQRVYLSRNHKGILCVHHVSFLSPYQMPDKLIYSYSLCLWRSSLLVPDFCHYITFSLVYVAVLFILLST